MPSDGSRLQGTLLHAKAPLLPALVPQGELSFIKRQRTGGGGTKVSRALGVGLGPGSGLGIGLGLGSG